MQLLIPFLAGIATAFAAELYFRHAGQVQPVPLAPEFSALR